jgi:hypothetical protein
MKIRLSLLADENNFYMLADVGGDDKRASEHAARIQRHAATQDGTTAAYARLLFKFFTG